MDDIITVSDLAGNPLHLRWMSGDEMLGGHLAGMFEYRNLLPINAANHAHLCSWPRC